MLDMIRRCVLIIKEILYVRDAYALPTIWKTLLLYSMKPSFRFVETIIDIWHNEKKMKKASN